MTQPNAPFGGQDQPRGYAAGGAEPAPPAPAYDGPPPAVAPGSDPVLLMIGDIAITQSQVILPQGRYPLRGSTWTVQDATTTETAIPAWAIVLAILFFIFCLLGLLFLLVKEKRYAGFVSISVSGPGYHHSVQFPGNPQTSAWAHYQVNQARNMAASAPQV